MIDGWTVTLGRRTIHQFLEKKNKNIRSQEIINQNQSPFGRTLNTISYDRPGTNEWKQWSEVVFLHSVMRSISAILPTFIVVLCCCVCDVQCLTATPIQSSAVSLTDSSGAAPKKTVLPHNGSFRPTISGELSVASMNILAPTYHSLSEPEVTREQYASADRKERVPESIRMAKQIGADVLCLQEVEGVDHLPFLEELLSSDEIREDGSTIQGYDSYSWSPLHPHRVGEVVGLCVAWKSDRHTLVSSHGFRRGQVVQLQEVGDGSTFCIGNVHLPARPSDIYGRLKAASTLCRRIEDCRLHKHSSSPLDGAAFVMGDFNCDASCSPVSFLRNGYQSHGVIFERNHRHKISKNDAKKFRHGLRFLDAYGPNLRKSQAAITVSLTGRGPGSMDHILYTPGRWGKTKAASRKTISADFAVLAGGGRRQKRRLRAESKVEARVSLEPPSMLRVDSVLATIDPDNADRTQLIVDGLPNLAAGFPSDHLPVGVLFTPTEEEEGDTDIDMDTVGSGGEGQEHEEISLGIETQLPEGIAPTVTKRRRGARSMAVITRQRHNALLRALTTWLKSRGVTDVLQDLPLYQWHWVEGLEYLRKKMRAPDLCCVAPKDGVLMMIEMTVSKSPTSVRKHKEKKYHDLAPILSSSPKVKEANLSVLDTFVVVVDEEGTLPPETINTLESLALLTAAKDDSKHIVDEAVREIALDLLRIRNHWMNQ